MIEIQDWGVIDYAEAWERQRELQEAVQRGERGSILVLCQHPTVITIGRNGTSANIVLSEEEISARNVGVYSINRGGDVTLHNPGQLVGYPIFRLTDFRQDLHWFLREIEACIIETVQEFGIHSDRVEGLTGVWVEESHKICAIGIHCSRWVTMHGFALNICNDIAEFDYIIPCGITDKSVTSLALEREKIGIKLLSGALFEQVKATCSRIFQAHFSA